MAQPAFQKLSITGELLVPCASRPPFDQFRIKPPGTRVGRGEPLTEGPHHSVHAALAPVAGTIVGEGTARLLNGRDVPAVRFAPDAPSESAAPSDALRGHAPSGSDDAFDALDEISPSQLGVWIDRLRGAGIWADRWTSPDLLGQLHQALRRPIDLVLCNVLNPDPSLPLHTLIAAAYPHELAAGVALLGRLTGASRGLIAVETAAPGECWKALRLAAERAGLKIIPVRNNYPRAHPTLLLHAVAGRPLRPGHLPTEQGTLLLDAQAAVAIGRWLLRGEPMLWAPLALYETPSARLHFVEAPIGATLRQVLEATGVKPGANVASRELRGGSPLAGVQLSEDCVAAGAELVVYVSSATRNVNPDPCIRCGWCVESCPVDIQPAGILEAAQLNDPDLAQRFGIDACIECGICSYVCPSHLPLLGGVRQLRGEK